MHRIGQVLLRKPEPDDIESLYVHKNDPELSSLLGGFNRGYSKADLRRWVEFHQTAPDEALFAIADASSNVCIGHAGFYKIDFRVGSAELAILLGERSWQGKGVGRSVTTFLLKYGYHSLNLRRIYLEVLSTNERAIKLYRSLGFKDEGQLRQHQFKHGCYVDVLIMGLMREEWCIDSATMGTR